MSKEKKNTIILTVILLIIALFLIGFLVVGKLKQSGTIVDTESKEIMNNFDKYFNSKEKTVIYYASTTCGWCSLQTPILETISEDYDMDYLYVDTSKLGAKQRKYVQEKLDIESGTPNTVIVEKGKAIAQAAGYTDPKEYIKFFKENGLIPEDAVYSKEKNLTFINFEQYESLISNNDTHIIVIGQTTCSNCIAIKPTLNEIAGEYNLTINYLNLTEMTQEEFNKLTESLEKIGYDEEDFVEKGSFGTPLILIIKNSKLNSYVLGHKSKSLLVKEFKKASLI